MSEPASLALQVIAKARAGDLQGSIDTGESFLSVRPDDAALRLFVGVQCCRKGDFDRGIAHLRQVTTMQPENPIAKVELTRAMLSIGDAAAVIDMTGDAELVDPVGRELSRLRAHALHQKLRFAEARALFAALVAVDRDDFESKNGLGLVLMALGHPREALLAFRDVARIRPAVVSFWINLSRAAAIVSEWQEAHRSAERALSLAPSEPSAILAVARSLAGLGDKENAKCALERVETSTELPLDLTLEIGEIYGQMRLFTDAEVSFRRAIDRDPACVDAWIGLGNVLERLNRQSDLDAHLSAARDAGVGDEQLALLRARFLRKAGRHEEALAFAEAAPAEGDPATRAQLIGTLADRLGRYETAFAAFAEANVAIAAAASGMEIAAESNITNYKVMSALLTTDWLADWSRASVSAVDVRRDPMFIFGFPRSGTTLIDTMLSGHRDTAVLEEEGIIQRLASKVGMVERVPGLTARSIKELRDGYFAEVSTHFPDVGSQLIVDKEPLGLSSTILLSRIFPESRYVFVERHPCDVVLSCWMTSFRFDHRVGSFYDLASIARLYDATLSFWSHCVHQLPIKTMTIRYERLIAGAEAELRRLADFADLDWHADLLANEKNAARRLYIGSPSYAQVGEPLYRHAVGRWRRYRPWIDEILPILEPWVVKLGYNL